MRKHLLPKFLIGKYQLIATVTFTALFSLVFLLISYPFSHNMWFELNATKAFAFTTAFYFISLLFVILSKRIMYAIRNMVDMTYEGYVAWNIVEALVICLLYTMFSLFGEQFEIISLHGEPTAKIFGSALVYCIPSIIVPYVIAGMYFTIQDKNQFIKLMNFTTVEAVESPVHKSEQKITLFDNSGVLKFSVDLCNLYYIESDDNYIIVWYLDNKEAIKSYMLRCRLKTVEESFKDSPLVRCHRKYIVNMDKVKILRKEKDGYEIILDNDIIKPIPITKTYSENVLTRFNEKR